MSKMDGLRAMREAHYAEMAKRTAAAAKRPGAKAPRVAPPAAPADRAAARAAGPDKTPASAEPALCGHRNMSGRSCTREHGHAAKSHRYS